MSDTAASTPAPAVSVPAVVDPLAFMDKLSDSVYVYRPAAPRPASSASPSLVIICAWMGARPAHIAKYLAPYRAGLVFGDSAPDPAILLLFCHKSTAASSAKAAIVAQTAVPVIRAILGDDLDPSSTPAGVPLVHVFSGGCLVLSQLYNALAQSSKHASVKDRRDCLPPHVTIFDSAPGNFWYAGAVAAFSTGLERQPLIQRAIALPLIYATVTAMYARIHGYRLVLWIGSQLAKLVPARPTKDEAYRPTLDPWRPHNDMSAYGGNRRELRRAYIYSHDDKMILATDTEIHASEARSRGFTVAQMAEFKGSAHVAHLRSDPVRYWQVVRDAFQGVGQQ
ncbi:hypothetical protein F503_07066 [Ophiostoma piceae UAMH 11346]|uniref:Indole-diterpene biosynthesis protein n=1 Tax=Ophiostoma piceae (strain UAMH 11346) TaxID=1262450 RepID=S3D7B5_OPHP1|nr:hypothetical protein F503_07066 [Ophiostoma piceae UAMH 11346]